jgi:hypothetical protein
MAQATEAACLLDTGMLYGRRVLMRPASGDPIFAGFKPGAFSLYHGDAPIVHFDREGRWQRAYIDGLHYLKGLDTIVQAIDRVREGENLILKRRTLSVDETSALDARIRAMALDLIETLDGKGLEWSKPSSKGQPIRPEELGEFLQRVARWDDGAWRAYRAMYLRTYGPLPFLPPDCTAPVVLQATLGDEVARAFGAASTAGYRARSPAEFDEHVHAVKVLLGRRLSQCKAVFLGGGDVLLRPLDDIVAYLESVARVFPIDSTPGHRHPDVSEDTPHRLDGVHAFLDRFTPPLPGADAWRRLRVLGLVRVSLGVESGDPRVRESRGVRWSNDELRTTVSDLKTAGVGVGVLILVGAGGVENAESHVEETARLVNSLEVGAGDLVTLLDAREFAWAEPSTCAPLSGNEWVAQRDELKSRLAPVRTGRKAKVVFYSLEKQGLL